MAFSFGASTSSTPSLFAGSSTPAFGGPASTPSLFGGAAPAFGAASTPSFFGSTPAPGAASTPSLFGNFSAAGSTASPPVFGSSQPACNAFGLGSGGSLFGATSTPAFGRFGQSQGGFAMGQQSSPSSALALHPQAGGIGTVDNKQLTHYTKWEEITQTGQAQLLEMEKKMSTMREESRQLEQCPRLYEPHKGVPDSVEDILTHNLKGLASTWISDEDAAGALNEMVHELLHDMEIAMRTFQRSYAWREAAKAKTGQVLMPALRELLSAPVTLPSLYIRKCVAAYQRDVEQYMAMVRELEKLLPLSAAGKDVQAQGNDAEEFLRSLPAAMQNMRDLLVHTAAKMEALHSRLQDVKNRFLDQQRSGGDYRNPFQDAEKKDKAVRTAVTAIPLQSQLALPSSAAPAAVSSSFSPGGASFRPSSGGTFGQQATGGFNMFSQPPQASSSRKTKAKK